MTSKKAAPNSITEYINAAPKEARTKLREIRACIRASAPGARKALSGGCPLSPIGGYWSRSPRSKHHIGFYPTPSAVKAFADDLSNLSRLKDQSSFHWRSRYLCL